MVKIAMLVSVFAFVVSAQVLTEDQKMKVKQYYKDCVAETNVVEELILKGRKGEFEDDPKLKQFIFCFFKKAGFQNENGELQLNDIRAKLPSDVNKNEADAVIEKCKDVTGSDSAEKAFQVYKCYWNATPNHISLV